MIMLRVYSTEISSKFQKQMFLTVAAQAVFCNDYLPIYFDYIFCNILLMVSSFQNLEHFFLRHLWRFYNFRYIEKSLVSSFLFIDFLLDFLHRHFMSKIYYYILHQKGFMGTQKNVI